MGNDVVRMTGSIHYTRPMSGRNAWSTSLIWGRNHNTGTQRNLNSYLLETMVPVTAKNFLTARAELVDKDELFAADHQLEHHLAETVGSTFRIRALTGGYTRDIGTFSKIQAGIGVNLTAYGVPSALKPYYGDNPWGVSVFLRFRLNPAE